MRHGDPSPFDVEQALEVLEGDDPALANVVADMTTWLAAHPCECEAGCECEWTQ